MKIYITILKKINLIVNSVITCIQQSKLSAAGVSVGNHTFISSKAYIDRHKGATISIGDNCYITRNVVILNHSDTCRGGPMGIWLERGGDRISKDVKIGDNVFIGVNSVILPGVSIGDNVVIGALTLVNKDIPDNTVWAGVPAKKISDINEMILKEFPKFRKL